MSRGDAVFYGTDFTLKHAEDFIPQNQYVGVVVVDAPVVAAVVNAVKARSIETGVFKNPKSVYGFETTPPWVRKCVSTSLSVHRV
ncbi:MAG: hypothetical protein OXR72_04550 [Gemmatimonadota bacterium]|nr:hypothetical protein [Gemmatimonadota bacterium]